MNYKKLNLKLFPKRDYKCDICKNDYLKNAYCCESLNFDICENCIEKI